MMTAGRLYGYIAELRVRSVKIQECIRFLELLELPPTEWDSFTMAHMGGVARAKKLKPSRRREIARGAALVRWKKTKKRRAGRPVSK
jgi:hypothetical protein